MQAEIPADIEERYQGQWIAWDIVTSDVVGTGETLEDAIEASNEAWNLRSAGHRTNISVIFARGKGRINGRIQRVRVPGA